MTRATRSLVFAVCAALLVLAGCGGGAEMAEDTGPSGYALQLTPKVGTVYTMNVQNDQSIDMMMMGQSIQVKRNSSEEARMEVMSVADDGTVTLEYVSQRVQIDMELPGQSTSYDSDDPSATPENPFTMGAAAMVDQPITMTVSPAGSLAVTSDISPIYDTMLDYMGIGSKDMRDSMRTQLKENFGPEQIAGGFKGVFALSAGERVQQGDTWTTSYVVTTAAPMRVSNTITFDSLATGSQASGSQAILTFEGSTHTGRGDSTMAVDQPPFTGMTMEGTQTGSATVDVDTGFPLESSTEMNTKGEATLSAQGRELPVQLDITVTTTIDGTVTPPSGSME